MRVELTASSKLVSLRSVTIGVEPAYISSVGHGPSVSAREGQSAVGLVSLSAVGLYPMLLLFVHGLLMYNESSCLASANNRGVKMSRRVVVPLDGSKRAEAILPHLWLLYTSSDVEVMLLTVVGDSNGASDDEIVQIRSSSVSGEPEKATQAEVSQEAAIEEAELYLEGVRKQLEGNGVSAQALVRVGMPAEEIVACAQQSGAEVIAMCTHGRTGVPRMLFGSVAGDVLSRTCLPVLVVKSPADNSASLCS
jgi:nucleotide-binding universal stress UspA family protein